MVQILDLPIIMLFFTVLPYFFKECFLLMVGLNEHFRISENLKCIIIHLQHSLFGQLFIPVPNVPCKGILNKHLHSNDNIIHLFFQLPTFAQITLVSQWNNHLQQTYESQMSKNYHFLKHNTCIPKLQAQNPNGIMLELKCMINLQSCFPCRLVENEGQVKLTFFFGQ